MRTEESDVQKRHRDSSQAIPPMTIVLKLKGFCVPTRPCHTCFIIRVVMNGECFRPAFTFRRARTPSTIRMPSEPRIQRFAESLRGNDTEFWFCGPRRVRPMPVRDGVLFQKTRLSIRYAHDRTPANLSSQDSSGVIVQLIQIDLASDGIELIP